MHRSASLSTSVGFGGGSAQGGKGCWGRGSERPEVGPRGGSRQVLDTGRAAQPCMPRSSYGGRFGVRIQSRRIGAWTKLIFQTAEISSVRQPAVPSVSCLQRVVSNKDG